MSQRVGVKNVIRWKWLSIKWKKGAKNIMISKMGIKNVIKWKKEPKIICVKKLGPKMY